MTDTAARLELIDQRVKSLGPDTLIAYLLWLFFGWVSAHRFYLRRPWSAILQILSYFVLIGLVWWLIDGLRLPYMIAARRAALREKLLASPDIVVRPGVVEAIGFNGRMTLENGNLTINRKPNSAYAGVVMLGTLGVQGVKTIPIGQITAVQLREPDFWLRGYIRLSINGRDPMGGIRSAGRDENAVLFSKYDLEAFKVLRDAIQVQINAIQANRNAPSAVGVGSQADEIEKMASLRDRGLLTDEEFAAKKQRILES